MKFLAKPSAKNGTRSLRSVIEKFLKRPAKLDPKRAQNFNKASIGDLYDKYGHSESSRSSIK
jgi:hypothetical protein